MDEPRRCLLCSSQRGSEPIQNGSLCVLDDVRRQIRAGGGREQFREPAAETVGLLFHALLYAPASTTDFSGLIRNASR